MLERQTDQITDHVLRIWNSPDINCPLFSQQTKHQLLKLKIKKKQLSMLKHKNSSQKKKKKITKQIVITWKYNLPEWFL